MGDENRLTKTDHDDFSAEEKIARLEQQLLALTPEYIGQKVDEALSDPENIRTMQERGINIDELEAKKPEMVENLRSEMGIILAILPEMEKAPEDIINEQVDQAIQDFPQMFDDALKAEIAESITAADKRIHKKFEDASTEINEAGNYLENGELPVDPDSQINKTYDAAVVNMANLYFGMRQQDPEGFDTNMKPVLESLPNGQGVDILELMDKMAAEAAADQEVGTPAGFGIK